MKHILTPTSYGPDKKPAIIRRINLQYKSTRFEEEARFLGFKYRIRSITETAEFMNKLRKVDVPCPKTYEVGSDYIIEEFISGQRLDEILPRDTNQSVANKFIAQVMQAHRQGVVIGDRWGRNEFFTASGEIIFIDFDLEYSTSFARELELAETINGIAMFSQNKKTSLWLKRKLTSNEITRLYNATTVRDLLEKHILFWGDSKGFLSTILS